MSKKWNYKYYIRLLSNGVWMLVMVGCCWLPSGYLTLFQISWMKKKNQIKVNRCVCCLICSSIHISYRCIDSIHFDLRAHESMCIFCLQRQPTANTTLLKYISNLFFVLIFHIFSSFIYLFFAIFFFFFKTLSGAIFIHCAWMDAK